MLTPTILLRGHGKHVLDGLRATKRTLRHALMYAALRSDYRRWMSPENLEGWWDERTEVIGKLVPAGVRVIEFGAGRRRLEQVLPLSCVYTPSDLVDRGPGTIICDLNRRPLPDLRQRGFQVAVFGGVLEYVKDVPSLVIWLASIGIETVIASFDAVPSGLSFGSRTKDRLRRFYFGYMNNSTEEQLVRCFAAAHMRCAEKHLWTTQGIYRFEKQP